MRRSALRRVAVFFLFLGLPAAALENNPVVKLDASGGEVFFHDYAGTSSSLVGSGAATVDWLVGNGARISENDLAIGTLTGQYLRSDQVNQIGGGGTLVSQVLDNSVSLKWAHSLGSWTLKPNVNFDSRLTTISNQESLGNGIYDLAQAGGGLDAEWRGGPFKSVRQSLSIEHTNYYHYQVANSPLFGSELLTGDHALDFVSYGYTLAADYEAAEDTLLSGSAGASYLDYARQPIFQGSVLTNDNRHDWMGTWLLSVTRKWDDWSAGLSGGYTLLSSNQNNFDAFQSVPTVFRANPNYYSYGEYSLGPLITATIGGKLKLSLSYNYTHRDYRDRPTQDASGNYLVGTVRTDTHAATLAVTYPLSHGFNAQGSAGYVYSTSNMQFERFYLYNYRYPFVFIGFGYAL